jgi:predicted RNA-binding Zn ribbon-like protein
MMSSKDSLLFVSNNLALDFLNTQPVLEGQPKELLGGFPQLLRWYVAAGLLPAKSAMQLKRRWGRRLQAEAARQELVVFRERLREVVLRLEARQSVPAEMIAELNRLLAVRAMPLQIISTQAGFIEEFHFDPQVPADLISPLVYAAADLLTKFDARRIRKCQNCVLHFYDTTKNATRRWCSMKLCGNRSKVASYTARHHR